MVSQGVSPEIEKALLAEVEDALGLDGDRWRAAEGRAIHIKEALRPTFIALPKNENGKLEHAAVRYVLHRLFVARHGWFIQGLQPDGEAWSSTSTSGILHDQVPEHVQSLFEKRIGGDGLGLDELTVLAATLEHLVHNEVSNHLDSTYRVYGISQEQALEAHKAQELIDTYMAIYILGGNISAMSPFQVHRAFAAIDRVYPKWNETRQFVRDVYTEVAPANSSSAMGFADVVQVAEEVGERYGRWQDAECRDLKDTLARYGDQTTGRVRLTEFYASNVNDGHREFSESIAYLRQLGALDESDKTNPRVIIPNYINSPSNCLASSSYYSVCCINECEELLGHLEENLGAPDASPAEITSLVAALPSATRAAGRSLSDPLLAKIREVAEHHGGRVPLHGRLFSQWMHWAYPMECPYPHVSGSTRPVKAVQWLKQTGEKPNASKQQMLEHIESSPASEETTSEEGVCGMWTTDEELVGRSALPDPTAAARTGMGRGTRGVLHSIVLFAAIASMAFAALRTAGSAMPVTTKEGFEKCFV